MVQRYVPEVRQGDKRIILVDGEPKGAVLRIPVSGEARANLHAGGRAGKTTLTPREQQICADDRPAPQGAGAHLCRHRRDRRLHHRDQRDLADRHPGDQPARRHQPRRQCLGRDRSESDGADGAADEIMYRTTPAKAGVHASAREKRIDGSRLSPGWKKGEKNMPDAGGYDPGRRRAPPKNVLGETLRRMLREAADRLLSRRRLQHRARGCRRAYGVHPGRRRFPRLLESGR